ncbi:mannose-6-phosphate isomerase, class I [Bacillaceae bacterium Marseille-Q3522]|nr:mannose-6-phosphate isomerase, class I [Bacillaceae bacterium Marseille-Q3522]
MVQEPIFFEPVFKERIWGGDALTDFGYSIPSHQTGECWAFAAHPHGQSVVKNGVHKGKTLGELWTHHRELFGNMKGDRFPLLTKILDAKTDLSVQVHPNDEYAMLHENGELGKTECWYIIDCKEGAELVYGHHAKTKEQLKEWIYEGKWETLLRKVPIKPGEFYYVPSGTIHAIGAGTVILETQQNSDTTYRVYDYDRKDAQGNTRELHIEQSIAVTTVPSTESKVIPAEVQDGDLHITTFIEGDYFSVYKWEIIGKKNLKNSQPFLLVSVINGDGSLDVENASYRLKKGDHFLLSSDFPSFTLSGRAELIVSHV